MREDPEATPWSGQLPEFTAERFHIHEEQGSYDMLQVTCPRPDCNQQFWVKAWWSQKVDHKVVQCRPCPYCFRSAWLPGLKPDRPAPNPRRVVKRRRK